LSFVFCLLSFVFCLLSFVFCLLSFVFCLLSLCRRLLSLRMMSYVDARVGINRQFAMSCLDLACLGRVVCLCIVLNFIPSLSFQQISTLVPWPWVGVSVFVFGAAICRSRSSKGEIPCTIWAGGLTHPLLFRHLSCLYRDLFCLSMPPSLIVISLVLSLHLFLPISLRYSHTPLFPVAFLAVTPILTLTLTLTITKSD
jgi:hypothetical protein